MPLRLKARCRHPGCGRAVRGAYCDEHQSTRLISDRGRGSATQRGYDKHWERVALERRRLDCYLCQACIKNNRVTMANLVDHIVPIHVRPDWRLEIGNTQVLCNACHTTKTNEDIRMYGGRTQRQLTTEQARNWIAAKQLTNAPRYNDACDM